MTAVRKIVDSNSLTGIFDLPIALQNRKVEVVLFPVEETDEIPASTRQKTLRMTMAQVEEWAKAPEIQNLVGILKGTDLPENVNIHDIRGQRLAEKYNA